MGSAVHRPREEVLDRQDHPDRPDPSEHPHLLLLPPSEPARTRETLQALRLDVVANLRRSRRFQHSSDPEIQAELDRITAGLEQVLMRLDLELAEPTRMQ